MKIDIRQCTATSIINDASFPALRREYADESAVRGLPDPQEKLELYQLMENSGALHVYGAFCDSTLVGFVAVLTPVLPHYGVIVAVAESLFVAAAYRKSGAGLRLIREAEKRAKDAGSPGLLLSSPADGRLATLLPRIGYHETSRVFLKRITQDG